MKKIVLLALLILLVNGCGIGKYDGQTAQEWADRYSSCENRLIDYQMALEEADSNIDDANWQIEDAQSYAGESYEDMEYALYNLYTVDTVDEP